LIIVDDGSDDDTFIICKSFFNKYSNIKYFKQKHKKLPIALNAGIQIAGGEFITFLGSDDEYESNHIKLRLDFFAGNPQIELIHGGVKIIGDSFVKDKNDFSKKIHLSKCVIGGTFFGKNEVFKRLNGFRNINYSEDSDFFERAIQAKIKIEKVNFPTYIYYRDSADGICNSI